MITIFLILGKNRNLYIRSEIRIHTCHCLSKIYRHTKGRWTRWCTYRTESLRTYITYDHRWKRQQRPRHSVRGCHRGKPAQGVTTVDRDRPRCPRDLTIKLISPPTRSAASFFTSLLHSRSSFVPQFTSPLHTWSIRFIRYPYDVEPIYEPYSPAHSLTFLLFFLRYRLPIGWVLKTFHNAFERSYRTSETRACNRSTTLLSSLFETMPDARVYTQMLTRSVNPFPLFLNRRKNRQKWKRFEGQIDDNLKMVKSLWRS